MRPEPAAPQDLIESLADGALVDWPALEAAARNNEERRRYRNLRLVARIAELHRTMPVDAKRLEAPETEAARFELPITWGHLEVKRTPARRSDPQDPDHSSS
jgi:hypothetical protein